MPGMERLGLFSLLSGTPKESSSNSFNKSSQLDDYLEVSHSGVLTLITMLYFKNVDRSPALPTEPTLLERLITFFVSVTVWVNKVNAFIKSNYESTPHIKLCKYSHVRTSSDGIINEYLTSINEKGKTYFDSLTKPDVIQPKALLKKKNIVIGKPKAPMKNTIMYEESFKTSFSLYEQLRKASKQAQLEEIDTIFITNDYPWNCTHINKIISILNTFSYKKLDIPDLTTETLDDYRGKLKTTLYSYLNKPETIRKINTGNILLVGLENRINNITNLKSHKYRSLLQQKNYLLQKYPELLFEELYKTWDEIDKLKERNIAVKFLEDKA